MSARRWEKLKFALMLRALGLYRQITLGTRCAVIVDRKVLLIRHAYVSGWQFPGGGVEPGESAEQSVRREVREETGFDIDGPLRLFGLYHSTVYTNRDHVAFYIADQAEQAFAFVPNREIAEIGWFDLDHLPEGLSLATGNRLAEISGSRPPDGRW